MEGTVVMVNITEVVKFHLVSQDTATEMFNARRHGHHCRRRPRRLGLETAGSDD